MARSFSGTRPIRTQRFHGATLAAALIAVAVAFAAMPAAASASVSDWSDLQSAFATGGTVQLGATITAASGDSLAVGSTAVTLDLNGYSLTIAGPSDDDAAISVPAGDSLTIEDTSGAPGTLTVIGGSRAAGIGGAYGAGACGTVAIESGTVNATGGADGPGIGGGPSATDGGGGCALTVSGGMVIATGANGGAGIGGGHSGGSGGAGGTADIDGGTVIATGVDGGAGIGGGLGGNAGGAGANVDISGGTVTATAGLGAAGIGGAPSAAGGTDGGAGGTVTISGGSVTAGGPQAATGIGGGGGNMGGGSGGTVTISGGSVTAQGDEDGVGIGIGGGFGGAGSPGGPGGAGAAITIDAGAEVSATGTGGAVGGGISVTDSGNGDFGSLSNAGDLTIPSGATLSVPSAETAENSGTLDVEGTLSGDGTVDNTGVILAPGTVAGNGDGDGNSSLLVEPDNYALSFDVNGGSGATPATEYVYAPDLTASDQALPGGPTPPAGAAFTGWFTAAAGGTEVTDGSGLEGALGDGPLAETLYAQYAEAVGVSTQPQDANVTVGDDAVFKAAASGYPAPVVQWQSSRDGGASWSDVAGATSTTLTLDGVTLAESGNEYRAIFTNASGSAASDAATLSVAAVTSAVTLSTPAATVYGQPAAVIATVTEADASSAGGSVQFTLDGGDLGSPVTVTGGQATSPDLSTSSGAPLAPGSYQIGATFTPQDGSVYAPASAPGSGLGSVTEVIAQASTATSIAVNGNTLTATVSAVAPGAGTPAGAVSFELDGQSIGTAALSDGSATLHHTVPSGASDAVSAIYLGDADFSASLASMSRNAPSITARLSSAHPKTRYGWYRAPVTVTFTCVTHGSAPTGACPSPVVLSHSGAAQSVTRTITATDGGAAIAVVKGIDIDTVAPSVKLGGVANGRIYEGSAPSASCVAHDSLSGVASCQLMARRTQSHSGLDTTTVDYTATATDRAGNTRQVSGSYRTLGIYLQGVSYRDGAFQVRLGRTYTIIVRGTGARPRYTDASPGRLRPAGAGSAFQPIGRDTWAEGVTLSTVMSEHSDWQLGVRIGTTLHAIRIHTG